MRYRYIIDYHYQIISKTDLSNLLSHNLTPSIIQRMSFIALTVMNELNVFTEIMRVLELCVMAVSLKAVELVDQRAASKIDSTLGPDSVCTVCILITEHLGNSSSGGLSPVDTVREGAGGKIFDLLNLSQKGKHTRHREGCERSYGKDKKFYIPTHFFFLIWPP